MVRIHLPPAESPCLGGFRPPTSRDPFGYWSSERDRWFEPGSLHQRVCCEPDFLDQGAENLNRDPEEMGRGSYESDGEAGACASVRGPGQSRKKVAAVMLSEFLRSGTRRSTMPSAVVLPQSRTALLKISRGVCMKRLKM